MMGGKWRSGMRIGITLERSERRIEFERLGKYRLLGNDAMWKSACLLITIFIL